MKSQTIGPLGKRVYVEHVAKLQIEIVERLQMVFVLVLESMLIEVFVVLCGVQQ
jgi:hypothetical protein